VIYLIVALAMAAEEAGQTLVRFPVAMIVWSLVTVIIMAVTAIAVYFAKSWKIRVDDSLQSKRDDIEGLKKDHSQCALNVAQNYVDKTLFTQQVQNCANLQNIILGKIDKMYIEISDTKAQLAQSELRIIKEIKNGNKNNK
jgi:hypothetical protein